VVKRYINEHKIHRSIIYLQSYILLVRGECCSKYNERAAVNCAQNVNPEHSHCKAATPAEYRSPCRAKETSLRSSTRSALMSANDRKRLSMPSQRIVVAQERVAVAARGVYFAKAELQFGSVPVGSMKRMTVAICNASDNEVINFFMLSMFRFV
jgi:hypothetical protein